MKGTSTSRNSLRNRVGEKAEYEEASRSDGRTHIYKSDPMSMLEYHVKSHKRRLQNVP